jgi:hypothetical protein
VVNLWDRIGNTRSVHQVAAFFDQTCRELPATMAIRRVLADIGFYEEGFLEHLEATRRLYIVAKRLIDCVKAAFRQIGTGIPAAPGIEMAEAWVRLITWKRERRMVFVRQHIPTRPRATGKQLVLFADLEQHRDYRYGAMVTNDEDLSPLEVWRAYRPRAKSENIVKEIKDGYGWHEFNVSSSGARKRGRC